MTLKLQRADLIRAQNFIAGRWCDAGDGARFGVLNPADESRVGQVPDSGAADVMLALDVVRAVREHVSDVVILATHDTDLEPALDEAMTGQGCLIESAGWDRARQLRTATWHWHTVLRAESFVRSRDRKDYT